MSVPGRGRDGEEGCCWSEFRVHTYLIHEENGVVWLIRLYAFSLFFSF